VADIAACGKAKDLGHLLVLWTMRLMARHALAQMLVKEHRINLEAYITMLPFLPTWCCRIRCLAAKTESVRPGAFGPGQQIRPSETQWF
jgi:hypothetical protein